MAPELIILAINITIILIAYLYIYPKRAGSDGNKIALHDLIASLTSVIVASSLFWGSEYDFNLIITTVNWFWFTVVTYFALEVPFVIWYYKKHKVWETWST